MFKGIWRSVLKWWRSGTTPQKALTAAADLPPLAAPDYEYLFMQLLEGVSHGWQQPRAIEFFRKIKQRAPKSQWIEWLNTFGPEAVSSPSPNEELARRMIQLGDLDCSEVTSLAGEYGHQILGKIYGGIDDDQYLTEISDEELASLGLAADGLMSEVELPMDLPANDMESIANDSNSMLNFSQPANDFGNSAAMVFEDNWQHEPINFQPLESPVAQESPTPEKSTDFELPEPLYKSRSPLADLVESEDDFPTFGEVPESLRLGNNKKRPVPPPPPSGFLQPITLDSGDQIKAENPLDQNSLSSPENQPVEEREISIEEFALMLQSDPELLQDISKQLGIETTDPQVVVDTVIAQMQQQIANGQN
jgi:hypothetical protein